MFSALDLESAMHLGRKFLLRASYVGNPNLSAKDTPCYWIVLTFDPLRSTELGNISFL